MVKKKTKLQKISLKKYIVTRARSLPIYKCYALSDNETFGMKDILVIREKKNGNLLLGVYLIDMYCQGLKDTFYYEVSSITELEESFFSKYHDSYKEIDSVYAFNCIYGAIEYAEDCGIMPHKDFKITEYLLDDVDDVEYLDIAFGLNGKPFLVIGPYDNAKKLFKILNEAVGENNYKYLIADNPFDEDDDFEDDDFSHNDDAEIEKLSKLSIEEKGEIFSQILIELPEDIKDLYVNMYLSSQILHNKLSAEDLNEFGDNYIEHREQTVEEFIKELSKIGLFSSFLKRFDNQRIISTIIENYLRANGIEFLFLDGFVNGLKVFSADKEVVENIEKYMMVYSEYFLLNYEKADLFLLLLLDYMALKKFGGADYVNLTLNKKKELAEEAYNLLESGEDLNDEHLDNMVYDMKNISILIPKHDRESFIEKALALEKPEMPFES
jgi:hypothetical protein